MGMNTGIHVGTRGGKFGGAENTILALTEALIANGHHVTLISHDAEMTPEKFFRGGGPDGVGMRHAPEDAPLPERFFWGRRRAVSRWNAAAGADFDLLLNFANRPAPFCHARVGIMRVFFPFQTPTHACPASGWRGRLRALYFKAERNAKWRTYSAVAANSSYTAGWVRKRWGVDARVIHPPVDTAFPAAPKQPLIVSVGRFALWGNAKKQKEMMEAFRAAADLRSAGWRYATIGGGGDGPGDAEYLDEVRRLAPVEAGVMVDAPRDTMKSEIGRASIFWHAAGYGEDPERHPERYEHFGQSTVEAMAAGCVPVVIHGGGQPEIVEHGVSGFLWRDMDEMLGFTRKLAEDAGLRRRMSEAATRRAAEFSREVFVGKFLSLIGECCEKRGMRP